MTVRMTQQQAISVGHIITESDSGGGPVMIEALSQSVGVVKVYTSHEDGTDYQIWSVDPDGESDVVFEG